MSSAGSYTGVMTCLLSWATTERSTGIGWACHIGTMINLRLCAHAGHASGTNTEYYEKYAIPRLSGQVVDTCIGIIVVIWGDGSLPGGVISRRGEAIITHYVVRGHVYSRGPPH